VDSLQKQMHKLQKSRIVDIGYNPTLNSMPDCTDMIRHRAGAQYELYTVWGLLITLINLT